MTCKDCIGYEFCSIGRDEDTIFYGKDIACNDVEDLCRYFKNKADFVEVVRCEECRLNVANMKKDGFDITDYSGEDIVCSYFMTDGMLPTDYCSYGERREDNG